MQRSHIQAHPDILPGFLSPAPRLIHEEGPFDMLYNIHAHQPFYRFHPGACMGFILSCSVQWLHL